MLPTVSDRVSNQPSEEFGPPSTPTFTAPTEIADLRKASETVHGSANPRASTPVVARAIAPLPRARSVARHAGLPSTPIANTAPFAADPTESGGMPSTPAAKVSNVCLHCVLYSF